MADSLRAGCVFPRRFSTPKPSVDKYRTERTVRSPGVPLRRETDTCARQVARDRRIKTTDRRWWIDGDKSIGFPRRANCSGGPVDAAETETETTAQRPFESTTGARGGAVGGMGGRGSCFAAPRVAVRAVAFFERRSEGVSDLYDRIVRKLFFHLRSKRFPPTVQTTNELLNNCLAINTFSVLYCTYYIYVLFVFRIKYKVRL